VDTVLGIPGVQTYELFDSFARAEDALRVIGTRHEQTAGYMAFGYAQATGRTGVYTVVPGPGVLNSSAALLTAFGASAPVLCLTSEVPRAFLGRGLGHLHEMPDSGLRTILLDIDPRQTARLDPDIAVTGDAIDSVAALTEALAAEGAPRADRSTEFGEVKRRVAEQITDVGPEIEYLAAIRQVLPRDGLFVEEICQTGFTSYFGFEVYSPRTFITGGYQGTLGFGYPTALGERSPRTSSPRDCPCWAPPPQPVDALTGFREQLGNPSRESGCTPVHA
jgi:thiamine pyrophosphate-dependent acetolactate synthase large subunit-like protein